jgi:hypothetical protein
VTWTGWRTKSVGYAHEILEGLFAKCLTEELNRETLVYFTLVEKGATIPVPEALLYRKSNRY